MKPSVARRRSRFAHRFGRGLVATCVVVLISGSPGVAGASRPKASAATAGDPVLAAAGDIACAPGRPPAATHCQQAATGDVLATINPSLVLPLGDTQYVDGTPAEYAGSYDLTNWGTNGGDADEGFKSVSRPAPGNHEYHLPGATGYFGYFGSNAGDPSNGYYSYDVAGPDGSFHWHMISLNSECAKIGGCAKGSAQEQWLKSDLAAHPNVCTVAYWHRPRFSSSATTPSSTAYLPFWNDLYAAGADIVLNGHAHDYERFAPQTPTGEGDPDKGVREFVVGTGGDDFQAMGAGIKNSVVRNNSNFGVLKMTLHAHSYDWKFMPAAGYSFTDSGSGTCHASSK